MPHGRSDTRLRDSFLTSALTSGGPWRVVDVLDAVDSTNAASLRAPQAWRVVVAAEQTAGRGRRARGWVSPPGTSVAVSLTVPMAADPASWGWLPLLTGLATRDALEAVSGSDAFTLKWPNDVLALESADGAAGSTGSDPWRKICGILCETAGSGLVVAGVGVNVSVPRTALPVATATSLQLCGHRVDREDVVIALVEAFARWHGHWVGGGSGLDLVRAAYRRHCSTLGTAVRIHLGPGQVVAGRALDVDDSGEIVIQATEGVQRFAAGDVVHLRPSGRDETVTSRADDEPTR